VPPVQLKYDSPRPTALPSHEATVSPLCVPTLIPTKTHQATVAPATAPQGASVVPILFPKPAPARSIGNTIFENQTKGGRVMPTGELAEGRP
jgi:hypothetical protein